MGPVKQAKNTLALNRFIDTFKKLVNNDIYNICLTWFDAKLNNGYLDEYSALK